MVFFSFKHQFNVPLIICLIRAPAIDRSSKPSSVDHFTSTGGNTQNPYGLRDVIVPQDLIVKFMNLAHHNTANNVETCGILCGKLVYFIFLCQISISASLAYLELNIFQVSLLGSTWIYFEKKIHIS